VPKVCEKLHGWWHERIVLGELEFGREDATFVWSSLRAFDQSLPDEQVVLLYRASSDAIRRVLGEVLVFLE